ncbi:hypothetical protein, partial [Salmonella sp. s54395]|uniref:hypothetical protein n=1 Tax=Salmonella sp. s54395 TaxID=3159664 RepID=UPI0039802EB2
VLCLRDKETINAKPALASHAEKVNKSIENLREIKFSFICDHDAIFKNNEISNNSKHNNNDKR